MDYGLSDEVLIGWIVFWLSYLPTSIVMTLYTHISKKRTFSGSIKEISMYICLNLLSSLFSAYLVNLIPPIELFKDSNWIYRMASCILISETWFYHSHLILHSRILYKYIHSIHHRYREPFALAAMYSHPLEVIFNSVPAVSLGTVLFSIHGSPLYTWVFLMGLNTAFSHSGVVLYPIINDSHDKHHKHFKVNYGTIGLFDTLYGTAF